MYSNGTLQKLQQRIAQQQQMTTQQQLPLKSNYTLQEIDKLTYDYLQSGIGDPLYYNKLTMLRQECLRQTIVQPNTFYVRRFKQHPQQQQQTQPDYASHPIYTHLPNGFKQELSEQRNNSNRFLPMIRNRTDPSIDLSKNEQVLSYLRNEESNAVISNSVGRFSHIRKLKVVIENEIIGDRVSQAQRPSPVFQINPANRYQQSEETTSAYSTLEGFLIRWDFASQLSFQCTQCRIVYGTFRSDEEYHAFKYTMDQPTIQQNYRTNKCMFQSKDLFRDIEPHEDTVLYLELWGFFMGLNELTPQVIGWSLIKMFDDRGQLIIGKFRLPMYSKEYRPNNLLSKAVYPYLGNMCLYMRILQPNNPTSDDQMFIESDYIVPVYHIHREALMIKPPDNSKVDKISLEYPLPLRIREPQLFDTVVVPPTITVTQDETMKSGDATGKSKYVSRFRSTSRSKVSDKLEQPDSTTKNRSNQQKRMTKFNAAMITRQKRRDPTKSPINSKMNTPMNKQQQPQGTPSMTPMSKIPEQIPEQVPTKLSTINVQTPSVQQKSTGVTPHSVSSSGSVIVKLNKLSKYDAQELVDLRIKLGFFVDQLLIKDIEDHDCVALQNLIPVQSSNDSSTFDFYSEFQIDFPSLTQLDGKAYVYLAIYHSNQTLLGWYVIELFKSYTSYQLINSGVYKVNLIDPPGQQAPFDESKMIRNNCMLEFVLMTHQQKQSDLDQIYLYEEIQTSKLKSVRNQAWNTQIELTILQLFDFPSKHQLSVKIAILASNIVVIDVIDRRCQDQTEIDAFSTNSRDIFDCNYRSVFKLGQAYLFDKHEPVNLINYVLTFTQGDTLLGVCHLPLFNKKKELQIGKFKHSLYNMNNKKTKHQVTILIKESPLMLDELERTPGYHMDRKLGGYTQLAKTSTTIQQQQQVEHTKYYPITITISQLQLTDVEIIISISKGNDYLLDNTNQPCIVTLDKPDDCVFQVPLDQMINEKVSLDYYQLIVQIKQQDTCVAWFAVNLIYQNKLYATKLFMELFRPPLQQPPVDFRQVKKLRSKIELQIDGDDNRKRRTQPTKGIKKTFTTITIATITGLQPGMYDVKMILLNDKQILQDKLLLKCETSQQLKSKGGLLNDLTYQFSILQSQMPDDAMILIQVTKATTEILWCYLPKLATTMGKIDKKMLLPPFMKPPYNKVYKASTSDISLVID